MSENRYCLQMVACGSCGNGGGADASSNIYSTEETVCGTWIDGKPIYRKYADITSHISVANPNIFVDLKDIGIEGVDAIVNIRGFLTRKAGDEEFDTQTDLLKYPVPFAYSGSSSWFMGICCSPESMLIQLGSSAYEHMIKFEVIIEYTKL